MCGCVLQCGCVKVSLRLCWVSVCVGHSGCIAVWLCESNCVVVFGARVGRRHVVTGVGFMCALQYGCVGMYGCGHVVD